MFFGLFLHVVSYASERMCYVCVFPCSLAHIWNTKLRVGLSCWFIFIFSYDDWGQLVLTTSTFVFLLEMKIWILFEAVSFCPDVLLVPSPQLSWNLPRSRSLLRSCPESPIPEDDSCTIVVGKSSSVLLLVTGVELVVWLEERFHSCSTRNVDAAL